ncbi:MAG: AbrB/MazE/SpoVT family DNA-binding domain-containing protein [Dehalococcoidia bacterium]|jgi:AbrB family looped-hinge helix DNA binding protein|nr:AbrB/MazE/SpoVT family DNA-binding domain-containing protein [Dehalococcoidia bacterium]
MAELSTTVTSKGQVTIPSAIRRALNIQPRDKISFELLDGKAFLRPVKSAVLASYGAVKPLKPAGSPMDYRELRQEIEEEIANEVAGEG